MSTAFCSRVCVRARVCVCVCESLSRHQAAVAAAATAAHDALFLLYEDAVGANDRANAPAPRGVLAGPLRLITGTDKFDAARKDSRTPNAHTRAHKPARRYQINARLKNIIVSPPR